MTADFNNDGNLDMAISYEFSAMYGGYASTITIHFGDGAGHFTGGLACLPSGMSRSLRR